MELYTVENKTEWNALMLQTGASFLQSWEWGEVQKKNGRMVSRVLIKEMNTIICGMQIIAHTIPFGLTYWYIPFGPIFFEKDSDMLKKAMRFLCDHTSSVKLSKPFLIRIEPSWKEQELKLSEILSNIGFQKNIHTYQPQTTLIIDLTPSLEKILAQMEKNTRYNIHHAEKMGVVIKEMVSRNPNTFETFIHLIQTTVRRKKFNAHSIAHYQNLLSTFQEELDTAILKIFAAYSKDRIIGMNAIIYFGNTATNLLSGVLYEFRNLKAANLLRWHAIKSAKDLGCIFFDQWGISNRYKGVSEFKRGFGGKEETRASNFDLPVKKISYYAYSIYSSLRRFV